MATDISEVKVTDRFSLKDKNFLVTGGGQFYVWELIY